MVQQNEDYIFHFPSVEFLHLISLKNGQFVLFSHEKVKNLLA